MSANLQKLLKERKYFGTKSPLKQGRRAFEAQVYSDKYFISQLTCERELHGHQGCVNTLDFTIYDRFKGHRANIFSAKFMPQTSDNVIISGAGDSEVRIFDLKNGESPLVAMYVCHSDQVKKICVYDDNPNEFLTCSQDGSVRLFDLRVRHICSPHDARSFLTAQNIPSRQHPLPTGPDVQNGCPSPIVDYGKYNIELNSMTVNKIFPQYFAVAGMNDYIYLHDRRMMPARSPQGGSDSQMETLKCIKRFSPTLDGYSRPNKHITACTFSDSNGYELIGSWSSEGIYLFNINDSPVQSSLHSTVETSTRPRPDDSNEYANDTDSIVTVTGTTLENYEENNRQALWTAVVQQFISRDLANAMLKVDELLRALAPIDTMDANILKACCFFVRAAIMTCHINESFLTLYDNNEIIEMIEKAESFAPIDWKGSWCRAIGYWILCGGAYSNGCNHRDFYLSQSFEYAVQARHGLVEYFSILSNQPTSSTVTDVSADIPVSVEVFLGVIDLFLRHLSIVCSRDGYVPSNGVVLSDDEAKLLERDYQYHWLNFINVMHISSGPLSSLGWTRSSSIATLSPNIRHERDIDTELSDSTISSRGSSPTAWGSDFDGISEENDGPNDESAESLYTRVMSGQIAEEDADFDLEAMNILRYNTNLSFDTDVGVVKPRLKYVGHCNIETVKDVGFYGLYDEYVVSGSDRGHLFIWDKKTTNIVQILRADEDVVNVAKGHPFLPILAVSGIDSTVKIFKPTSRLPTSTDPKNPNSFSTSSRLYKKDEILASNGEYNTSLSDDIYMTRSMYAAFLRMGRQRSLLFNDDDDDDDDDDDENNFSSNSSSST
ncbi:hypothetical protein INT47_000133 [Mucor saturninus]|uniref:Uncharacterized protein n=1 Tax=Mucor saturninus TaxID=64648 RepID=A0A8H7RJW4_9FUNG|nr:hypothetical protein INT47_000133 [Mucor saturninus]